MVKARTWQTSLWQTVHYDGANCRRPQLGLCRAARRSAGFPRPRVHQLQRSSCIAMHRDAGYTRQVCSQAPICAVVALACKPCAAIRPAHGFYRQQQPCASREARGAAAASTSATSLIPLTLEEMASDAEHAGHMARVAAEGQAALTREERRRRQRALDSVDAPSFLSIVAVRVLGIQGVKPDRLWCWACVLAL